MGYFQVRYDSRVVMYDLRGFIRLATDQVISQSAIQYCCGVGVQRKCFYFESREVKRREDGLEKWFFKTLNSSVAADVVLVVVSRQSKGSTNKMNGCPFTFVTMPMSKVIFWDIFVRPPHHHFSEPVEEADVDVAQSRSDDAEDAPKTPIRWHKQIIQNL